MIRWVLMYYLPPSAYANNTICISATSSCATITTASATFTEFFFPVLLTIDSYDLVSVIIIVIFLTITIISCELPSSLSRRHHYHHCYCLHHCSHYQYRPIITITTITATITARITIMATVPSF